MDIASIPGTYLSKLLGRSKPAEAAAAAAEPNMPEALLAAGGQAAQARQILSRFDIRNITPREFSELAKQLYQAGVITSGDFQELAQLRLELDQSHVQPDQPVNLLDFVASRLRAQQQKVDELRLRWPESTDAQAPEALLGAARRQFEWVRKFADVQSGLASPSLDKIA